MSLIHSIGASAPAASPSLPAQTERRNEAGSGDAGGGTTTLGHDDLSHLTPHVESPEPPFCPAADYGGLTPEVAGVVKRAQAGTQVGSEG